jgi:hypothetical protein
VFGAGVPNLSWNRLFKQAAEAVLVVTGLPHFSPVFLALAGLVIVEEARSTFTHALDERHATVIYVLWRRGGRQTRQREEMLLPDVNHELHRAGKQRMTKRELRNVLETLNELDCVKATLFGWLIRDRVWLGK